jgi:hypothetical protein
MQLRPQIRIQTAIEALTHVVIPAIDPKESRAIEQAKLAVGMLTLVSEWLPYEYRYDCDELAHLAGLANDLTSSTQGGKQTRESASRLAEAAADGADALRRAGAEPAELWESIQLLRIRLGELVTAVFEDGELQSRAAVQEAVLDFSKRQVLHERSAVAGQGFEGTNPALPSLADLFPEPTRPRS